MNYQAVIAHFGGPAQLASALGIKRQAVYQWGGEIPQLRQFEIERLTGGKFVARRSGDKPDPATIAAQQ